MLQYIIFDIASQLQYMFFDVAVYVFSMLHYLFL
jgi:hypothetical protein